jgi:hypothetical protein
MTTLTVLCFCIIVSEWLYRCRLMVLLVTS